MHAGGTTRATHGSRAERSRRRSTCQGPRPGETWLHAAFRLPFQFIHCGSQSRRGPRPESQRAALSRYDANISRPCDLNSHRRARRNAQTIWQFNQTLASTALERLRRLHRRARRRSGDASSPARARFGTLEGKEIPVLIGAGRARRHQQEAIEPSPDYRDRPCQVLGTSS